MFRGLDPTVERQYCVPSGRHSGKAIPPVGGLCLENRPKTITLQTTHAFSLSDSLTDSAGQGIRLSTDDDLPVGLFSEWREKRPKKEKKKSHLITSPWRV